MRRIERAIEEELIELNLSGLELEELPPEIANCMQVETLLLGPGMRRKKNGLEIS